MGTIELRVASELRDELGLQRAVETGTYRGLTARALASLFESVITIELSSALHERAAAALGDIPNIEAIHGHSADVLGGVAQQGIPTFYFLDGHWSAGKTAGSTEECPVLAELSAIGSGHRDDCFFIDDARLFTSAPPPPHDPAQWPTVVEVFDAIRMHHPHHAVTLLFDQIIAVPPRAKPVIDEYGARMQAASTGLRQRLLGMLVKVRERVNRPN
jgi:hypothetical protein